MGSKWTLAEVARKVDYEGGIIETIYWGLTSNEIEDENLAALWAQVEAFMPTIEKINRMLPSDYEEDE